MPRYIDADDFEADCRKRYCTGCENYNGIKCKSCWVDDMLGEVEDAPTISPDEVRGVVHGTWVGIDDFLHETWECDRCGCVVENTDDPWNYFHYCPNCGAKMEVSG